MILYGFLSLTVLGFVLVTFYRDQLICVPKIDVLKVDIPLSVAPVLFWFHVHPGKDFLLCIDFVLFFILPVFKVYLF